MTPILLIEIIHDGTIYRFANYPEDIVSNANTYYKSSFRVTLPDAKQRENIRTRFIIDNTGLLLVNILNTTDGLFKGKMKILEILPDNPNNIRRELLLDIVNVLMTEQSVTGNLDMSMDYNRPTVLVGFTSDTTPHLFR